MKKTCLGLMVVLLASMPGWAGDNLKNQKITVRTSTFVSSDRSMMGDPVDAVLVNDLVLNGKVIATKGAAVHGIVSGATPSTRNGRAAVPGSVAIRIETVEGTDGTYHLSTNEYTREGHSRGGPMDGGARSGVSIDSVGGIHPQSPVPTMDPTSTTISTGGLEATIPPGVYSFKGYAMSSPDPKK